MKKILLLDIGKMLNPVIVDYLESTKKYQCSTIAPNPDNIYEIENTIKAFSPDVVINCAAILIKESEDYPDRAVLINSFLPHYLNVLSKKYHFKLIHRSTDCVFEGKTGSYTENSTPDAISFYGKTKAIGEINGIDALTLRVSIVGPNIDPYGDDLLTWFSQQNGTVSGYKNVFWTGVTTLEFAKILDTCIEKDLSGLIHVTNGIKISKATLLETFEKYFNFNIDIKYDPDKHCDKSLLSTKSYYFEIPSYDKMIEEMYNWIIDHKNLYNNLIERIKQ